MKVRHGFVSNSSSSSFCIYGFAVESSKYELLEKIEDWLKYKSIEGWAVRAGGNDSDYIYVGKKWSSIEDDQTGAQFKREIEEVSALMQSELKLSECDAKCGTHDKSWYDG